MAGVLNDLDRANTALDTAKKSGDLVKIAQAQQRVDELVGQLLKLRSSTPAGSASPSK
jgi:hypothetical protein